MNMSTQTRRQRNLTATSSPPKANEATAGLQALLERLAQVIRKGPQHAYPELATVTDHVHTIRQHLTVAPRNSHIKDDFRNLLGYQTLLDALRAYSGYYHPTQRQKAEKIQVFDLLEGILETLSETFQEHHGNRRYFKHKVEGGGWSALEQIIASTGIGGNTSDMWSEAQLFGKLLSFALGDKRLDDLCLDVAMLQSGFNGIESGDSSQEEGMQGAQGKHLNSTSADTDHKILQSIDRSLEEIIGEDSFFSNIDAIPTMVDFWKTNPRTPAGLIRGSTLIVVAALLKTSRVSTYNLVHLHGTGILATLLPPALEKDSLLPAIEQQMVHDLCSHLLSLGVNSLEDFQFLLRNASEATTDYLPNLMKMSFTPAYIQFDLSLHGYSSIELPSLIRPFPPPSTQLGYTYLAWVRIDRFDPNSHTTLFGAFDSTQTCFVLAYLEKDTHNFILQTSVTSTRPSVRFKSIAFKRNRWYHIAVVHRRSRTLSSSKAVLFVDGEMVEQAKCQYPDPPPLSTASTESFASFTSSNSKQSSVQAFVGTPQDLSAHLGRGLVLSRWSLASAHLFDDALSDDMIAVYHRLGPRYNGNFQDCLGSFQTYEASAALGMRNETMHPGKDEKSEIIDAIRGKAGALVPESSILLSILPTAMLSARDHYKGSDMQIVRDLGRTAANNLYRLTHNTGTFLAVNAAVPSINEALTRTYGTSVLAGSPIVVNPQSLDDAMWRLGGFASIALKMVEQASSSENFIRAVEVLFESIKGSWRNSEAMERENGYAILGALMRGRIGAGTVIVSNSNALDLQLMTKDEREKLGFQLLSLVLDFVGYNHGRPEESFIINPLAYRILLVDFDMWRKTSLLTQRLYFKQFVTFGVNSKHHQFNSRRLLRMRVVKRFIDALKAESFSRDVFPSFMEALENLSRCNLTTEVFRSLALFITYAYHTPLSSASRTVRAQTATLPARSRTISSSPRRPTISLSSQGRELPSSSLTKRELGTKVLQMYTNFLCEKGSTANIKKFARTVTNKWLLHLLTEDDVEVVVLGTKIIARLLIIHGAGYITKFAGSKTGGFTILRHRLRRWWDVPTLWPICLSILFARDVADVDFERPFELGSLLEAFDRIKVINPGVMPVIMSMMEYGLKDVFRNQDDPDSPLNDSGTGQGQVHKWTTSGAVGRHLSMSLAQELELRQSQQPKKKLLMRQAMVLHTVIHFLGDLHTKSFDFREYAVNSEYVRLLLGVLFPVIVNTDGVSADTELNSRDSTLTFEGDDVIIGAHSRTSQPRVRTSSVETQLPPSPTAPSTTCQRGSSFILLTSRPSEFSPSSARLNLVMSPKKKVAAPRISNVIIEGLLELVVTVFIDQALSRKDFAGFGLFLKVPPGFREHQVYFETFLLRNTIQQLGTTIQLDRNSLGEPKLIQNMARFIAYMGEAVYEGWFLGGADPLIDFAGNLLEYLQRPKVSETKSVRLCSQAILAMRSVFLRAILLRFSELDSAQVSEEETLVFMNKLVYWQTVILSSHSEEEVFIKLICYQLYIKLVDVREKICLAAADLWRIMLVQKPDETSNMLQHTISKDHKSLSSGFKRLTELDNQTFFSWVDEHRDSLDSLFFGAMSRSWEDFVHTENQKTEERAQNRIAKRRDKLRQWHGESLNDEDILFRHHLASGLWMKNIYTSEHVKHQRIQQDQQDNFSFLASAFAKMDHELHRPCGVFDNGVRMKWKLDRTEGRNRMRLRLLPDRAANTYNYEPKRKSVEPAPTLKVTTALVQKPVIGPTPAMSPSTPNPPVYDSTNEGGADNVEVRENNVVMPEEDFELVDDPNDPGDGDDGYEDRNRKVLRSLHHGDQVQKAFNISRIIGLDACEGLLILGRDCLYLVDNVFRRSDGEIVNINQAPKEERDPYLQMISGQNRGDQKAPTDRAEQESRSWKWSDVISISKRRFLFRDVAIEVFFVDGRSYLLTALSPTVRDELHSRLTNKAPHTIGTSTLPNSEDAWRVEAIKVADEAPLTFGSKFGSIFNSSAWNPAMRRWVRGDISNFHYLMLVNTIAGRTFNDLTQYPVFPWILADYTSEELDLKNPLSYRDLSKPMGAQNIPRQAEFIERYKTFAEMSDGTTPAFHYGTHYSSAMIVTSYLIRLQPFVQSYLLLQGGNFDHPDRLFYSIEKAWTSASRSNMTDVRELIPEFFYLPEFLRNSNGYNFGLRQGKGGTIDNVVLPPWAKGDPKIFIAKHREALESPYVSQHLHQWIDLIFGCKQRGEAAIESVNVFHHLSYHGASDLDNISDPVERLATIGIIHNFGQTPHQIFTKPHQTREETRNRVPRLDVSAHLLAHQPIRLFESNSRVTSLIYAPKLDRLLFCPAFKLVLPPHYDKQMEWGFADRSIRFFFSDSKKPAGLFENLHQGQISTAILASSTLLITAGEDCVVSAHTISTSLSKTVDLYTRHSLFGHKTPVHSLAVSKSFSTLLSASVDGVVLLWDLNRLEFVRKLTSGQFVECAAINDVTGTIMLCRGQCITLFTLNSERLVEQNVCMKTDADDSILSCAFYEGVGNEWLENELILTGHRRGVVCIWKLLVGKQSGKWELELWKKLDHLDRGVEGERNVEAGITAVRPMAKCVYTGDEDGRVYEWNLVQRER